MELSDYNARLDHIKIMDPDNVYLERLSKGLTLTNSIIIEREFNKLPPPKPARKKKQGDPIVERFTVKISKLYSQRAKLSNSFHVCKTNDDALDICMAIEDVQREIAQQLQYRQYYIDKKELPLIPNEDSEFDIPSDPVELMRKQNSLRSNISRTKAELKNINKTKAADKWDKANGKLQKLITHLKYVEQSIESKTVHSAGL